MARVRIPDELRDQVKEHVEDSAEYDTQSEFVKEAVREHLDRKKEFNVEDLTAEEIRMLKSLAESHLEN